jgi:putative phosphoesterase
MKLFIASDIHGSYKYARLLAEKIKEEAPDKVIFLGDILYHGPRNDLPEEYAPKKVIELFSDPDIICVKGNCDSEVDDMVLAFSVVSDTALITDNERNLHFCHGHRDVVSASEGDIVFSGHTHVPKNEKINGVRYINPGSVSIPKENSHHGYVIYENGSVRFYDVESGKEVNIK